MKILSNLLSKAPKIAIILAIMAAIAIHRDSFWGVDLKSTSQTTEKQNIAHGYAGPVPVAIEIGRDGKIDTVILGANDETEHFVQSVINSGFLNTWDGLSPAQAAVSAPDAVSGATYTSSAIAQNVRSQASLLINNEPSNVASNSTDWMVGQIAIFIVTAAALLCYLMPAKTKKLRIPLLIASVGVLGFWQGAFVSIELMYNWVVNGSHVAQIAIVVMVALAVGLPLLFNKSFYCTYLCPFGAMQELAGKVSKKKIVISPQTLRIFRYVKQGLLSIFVVLIFILPEFQPSSWEPFTAFIFASAAISSIVIGCVSIVASVFIPRAWCRLLCPTGEVLNLLQRRKR